MAVNTLLTVDDYAYMLHHSRAQAVMVSASLLPTLQAAMHKGIHEVRSVIVSRSVDSHPDGLQVRTLDEIYKPYAPLPHPATTSPDDPGFWLYSSGSTGRPKGTVHSHGNLYWTAKLYGQPILGITSSDICFSAAKLFFCLWAGKQ